VPDVVMPRLSDSMEEGTILRWLKDEGEHVGPGEPLVEIETDKATLTHEADLAGVLHIVAAAGETLAVGRTIATIGESDGGGPAATRAQTGKAKGDVAVEELSRGQQLVARRVAESRATIPDHTVTVVVDMERCAVLRTRDEAGPTFDDMVLKAAALALREHPRVNGAYRDGRFELFSRVNVGFVVPADNALLVPTIFDADRKPLADIARETAALAERVRTGAITPPELSGGTFTVSSLGAYGIRRFSTIVTPSQAAALAVGAVDERVAVIDGQALVRHQLEATLACDHRILYAADAARFLARVRELLEDPSALLP
jgi:pyruvate dehydrogenase E2 component (dihydrolipoyllysine-residue acetyltransferase)